MKFNVPIKEFEKAIGLAGSSVAAKGPRPVLACLKIEANIGGSGKDPEVLITGTDLETMMTVRIPIEGGGTGSDFSPGTCVVPAKLLREVVAGLGSASLFPTFDISLEENGLKIANSGGEFAVLNCADVEEFPPMMVEKNSKDTFFVETSLITNLLEAAVIAVNHGDSSHQGTVCLTFAGGANVVATDGFRLVTAKFDCLSYPEILDGKHLVPESAVHRLLAMSKDSKDISVGKVGEMLVFTIDNAMLATRLFDGKFPDPNRVMPKAVEPVVMAARDLKRALDVVSPMAAFTSGMVRIDISKFAVEVFVESREEGSSRTRFNLSKPREIEEGKDFKIAFNIKYLKDFLKINSSDQIEIGLQTPSYPAVFRSVESSIGLKYLLMPMTVG